MRGTFFISILSGSWHIVDVSVVCCIIFYYKIVCAVIKSSLKQYVSYFVINNNREMKQQVRINVLKGRRFCIII